LETADDEKDPEMIFKFPFDESMTTKSKKSEIKRQESYNEVRELRDTVFQLFSDECMGKKSQAVVRIPNEEDSNVLAADTPINKRREMGIVENSADYRGNGNYVYIKLCE